VLARFRQSRQRHNPQRPTFGMVARRLTLMVGRFSHTVQHVRFGRNAFALAALPLVVVAMASCSADADGPGGPGPLTVQDGDFTTSVAYQGGEVHSSADVRLCVEDGPAVDLVSLTAVDATDGASVSDFDAVTIKPGGFADNARPLDRIKSWSSHQKRVDEPCGDSDAPLLAIELRKSTPVASFPSFVLAYRVGEKEYEVPVEFPMTLCSDLEAPSCEP